MKRIDYYLAKNILSAIGLVTLMLAGLQIFILLVNQIDDMGRGHYHLLSAIEYVFLAMPYQVYLFFPMASLLGCLIGLGSMANYRELLVMRTSGVSIMQVMWIITKAAMLVILLVTVLGETLVPKLALMANDIKLDAISDGQTVRTRQGVWLRRHNDFIAIDEITPDNQLVNVTQFHFNEAHQLQFARLIHTISFQAGHWVMHDIEETQLNPKRTKTRIQSSAIWEITIDEALLNASNREPDEMTLLALNRYVREMKRSHQGVLGYELAFWQRLIQPLTTWVMMVLAIPFIFGPLRSTTMGAKLLLGAGVGFGFYLLNRFLGPFSAVYQLPAAVVAVGPTLLFALLGLYMMKRAR